MATKKDLKDRAVYGKNIAHLLFLKAMNQSSEEVREMILEAMHLDDLCQAVLPEDDNLPAPNFERLAEKVDTAEHLLIGKPQA